MKLSKKAFLASLLIFTSIFAFAESETSVEDEYLNDVDGDIISTLADSDDYDNKLVALQYLEAALDDGNDSPAVIQALDKLAGEGLNSQVRENGRLINNYPDIRREACLLMAKVPTEHTKNTLINIAISDNEPMVIAAAVSSLGEIGVDPEESVDAICFAQKRNQYLNPTSSLALEVLNAFEKLADDTENRKSMLDTIARIAADYNYVTPVRQKAKNLLKTISSSGSSDKKKSE